MLGVTVAVLVCAALLLFVWWAGRRATAAEVKPLRAGHERARMRKAA